MSVGLEDTEDLIEDLDQALKNAVGGKNYQVSYIGCLSYMLTWVITTKLIHTQVFHALKAFTWKAKYKQYM